MAVFFRLVTILWTLVRYRLDQVVPAEQLPWHVRLLLLPCKLWPAPKLNRGERLRHALEDLGPIFIKFGQLLSTRPDLIPEDIVEELNRLQDKVPPFDKELFRRLVETALDAPVETVFQSYERDPLASASVAQVHGATLHSGQSVVIKVIRPGIERVIAKDVRLLYVLAHMVERYSVDGKRLRPVEVVEDYRTTIFDELDLQREAANASQLRRNFLHSPLLYVPEVFWDYTRNHVLVMERIDGIPVNDVRALVAQGTDMKALAERGVEIFFKQVFEHNFFHADMHPGNIFVARENPEYPRYIAVDMAIVGSLTREDQYYLARNMLAMFRRDYRQVAELHVQSGWVPEHTRIEELEAAVRTVCEPIFEKPLKDISFGQVLMNLFRTARRFDMEVQPQLVLLQKTLLNIEGLGRQLYPDLDLWTTAHPFLERWLKEHFHPKAVWSDFKRYGPEWLEKFPMVPQLLLSGLQQAQNVGDVAPQLRDIKGELERQRILITRSRRRAAIGVLAILGAGIIAWPTLETQVAGLDLHLVPMQSWALLAFGAVLILFRK
ncbi:ubiquinone biosynthesis regulatory protein kinase UbiB [Marinimicrobium sp. ABcell2]|uniref:ubiquinone biosynthesis regulatory protein kinase UbiB n=1 Tax=Marinimicrobium sp. ABcell2 TaxID=3069751 RepID=UPI0027B1089E|nr:ubiquinone biosynthesis regulatory protein kinase UbiB [Marinimicrobium sp. ABcell2]MDQ2075998.1 ubiquinone biosynthesis regulatory protein kinase UbiB [Marinimicrobium sp. ABcell2]